MKVASIDKDRLLALAGDDRELLVELVQNFLKDSRAQISQMEKEPSTVKSILHQLKGASGSLGLSSLFEICQELEQGEYEVYHWGEFRTHLDEAVSLALDSLRA